VRPTKPLVLASTGAVVFVVSYVVVRLWDRLGDGDIPPVPLSAPITLAVLAAAVLAIALGLRSRFAAYRKARIQSETGALPDRRDRPAKPIDPIQAARALVLAKASGLVGAIFGGAYGGYGLFLLGRLNVPADRSQAIRCGLALAAGIVLAAAALYLERVLKVPPQQPSDGKVPSGA
jgi:hypothetical protein